MGAPHGTDPSKRQVAIAASGLSRLDFYVDDRPQHSTDLEVDAAGYATLTPAIRIGARLLLIGFARDGKRPAAAWRATVA
jgi:hypothetical protein